MYAYVCINILQNIVFLWGPFLFRGSIIPNWSWETETVWHCYTLSSTFILPASDLRIYKISTSFHHAFEGVIFRVPVRLYYSIWEAGAGPVFQWECDMSGSSVPQQKGRDGSSASNECRTGLGQWFPNRGPEAIDYFSVSTLYYYSALYCYYI